MSDIDSGKLMYSGGNNDECYTPDYGVTPILKYIPKDAKVWCPFDTACLLYTSPSPRDYAASRMPSSA